MAEENHFQNLIRRVRAGDEAAAAELVRRYEPHIRRAVRIRLLDPRLKRFIDSMDICQSVLASFFIRTALGQYHLHTPEQLLKLLATMARNKRLTAAIIAAAAISPRKSRCRLPVPARRSRPASCCSSFATI